MPTKKEHLHTGHRERMRERVGNAGASVLADHELLEMLLYYIQPRRDTNETAHALIEECGSLAAVLEADAQRLCRVPYIKEGGLLAVSGILSARADEVREGIARAGFAFLREKREGDWFAMLFRRI